MFVNVRKEILRCDSCKYNNAFLYLSDYAYGEKLVLYNNGQYYAYLNLYNNDIYDEFVDLVQTILKSYDKEFSDTQIQEIVNSVFHIACDKIEDSEVSLCNKKKCINCGSVKFEDLLVEPEKQETIDVQVVTHNNWDSLSYEQRYERICNAIKLIYIICGRTENTGLR